MNFYFYSIYNSIFDSQSKELLNRFWLKYLIQRVFNVKNRFFKRLSIEKLIQKTIASFIRYLLIWIKYKFILNIRTYYIVYFWGKIIIIVYQTLTFDHIIIDFLYTIAIIVASTRIKIIKWFKTIEHIDIIIIYK